LQKKQQNTKTPNKSTGYNMKKICKKAGKSRINKKNNSTEHQKTRQNKTKIDRRINLTKTDNSINPKSA
jgi:hypothetical protein